MNKKSIRFAGWLLLISLTGVVLSSCKQSACSGVSDSNIDIYSNIEFEMPKVIEPSIPNYSVSLINYGGISDGQTLNTGAFKKAIEHLSEKGGGKLIVPKGIWLTGPIQFKSNINIHLEAGALILFSRNFDDYPIVETSFEGLETYRCTSPIFGKDLENIAITGTGVIDGSGDAWRPVKKAKLTEEHWNKLIKSGGVVNDNENAWFPTQQAMDGSVTGSFNVHTNLKTKEDFLQVRDFLRPVLLNLVNCNKVLLDGPTFQNSPAWNLHPLMCENVTLRNLTVKNPWYSQNGDGLDLESCKNVVIYNCSFDVGDDAICIKSGKNEDGRERGMPTENTIIKNCVVYHGHGGFVVGSEMSGGVKNMHVSNCTFLGTDIGLRFKSTRGRGGVVQNIYISDINMINIPTEAIRFNLFYMGFSPVPEEGQELDSTKVITDSIPKVTEETPQFKDIHMKNITCVGARQAIHMQGLPEMNLENISLENIYIKSDNGIECIDANGITFTDVNIDIENGPVFKSYNSKNITVSDFKFNYKGGDLVVLRGARSENIQFSQSDFKSAEVWFVKGVDFPDSALVVK